MADWDKPALTDLYQDFLDYLKDRDVDLAKMFNGTTSSHIPTGAVGWNQTNNRFEKWDGNAWQALTTLYQINGDKVDGFDANATPTANQLLPLDGSAQFPLSVLPASLTGKSADQLDGQEGTYYLSRANHTGTQLLSTLSDHNKAAHDSLGINAATVNGISASATATANKLCALNPSGKGPFSITGDAQTLNGNAPSAFEPAFTKNGAFNKDFGTSADTVAEGNHNHPHNHTIGNGEPLPLEALYGTLGSISGSTTSYNFAFAGSMQIRLNKTGHTVLKLNIALSGTSYGPSSLSYAYGYFVISGNGESFTSPTHSTFEGTNWTETANITDWPIGTYTVSLYLRSNVQFQAVNGSVSGFSIPIASDLYYY